MAMTSNSEINQLAINRYEEEFGRNGVYRIPSRSETELDDFSSNHNLLFAQKSDYLFLASFIRMEPTWSEQPLESQEQFESLLKKERNRQLPVFIRKEDGRYELVNTRESIVNKGDVLIALRQEDSRPMYS